jgi:glycosyltransferase involved in cell wall biosynthesis
MPRLRHRRRVADEVPPFAVPPTERGVLQVCHPEWRGVRASALAFRDPIIESTDLDQLVGHVPSMVDAGVRLVVIQGWPPNADGFARAAARAGLVVAALSHSAPSQHGVDAAEAEALAAVFGLRSEGVIDRVATVKAGVSEAFASLGQPVVHVPNRVPIVDHVTAPPLGGGIHAGVFLFPMWRKNVTTQLLATSILGWTAHVMADPGVAYLSGDRFVVHGELARDEFLPLMASMDIVLNVTLSECHPMMPMEAYAMGVPCLMSRTSDLFVDNDELYALTTVDRADEPSAVATAARRLIDNRDRVVPMAQRELVRIDERAAAAWHAFTDPNADVRGP